MSSSRKSKNQNLPTTSKDDNSDRKSLNKLMDVLEYAKETHSKQCLLSNYYHSKSNVSDKKQSPKKNCRTGNNNKKSSPQKTSKFNDTKSTKITGWLSKDKCIKQSETVKIEKERAKRDNKKRKMKPEKLDVTIKKSKTSTGTKLIKSKSFEKYGMVLPSFEKIVAEQKSFDDYKKCIESLDTTFDDNSALETSIELVKKPKRFSGDILDCKHLTLNQLSEGFEKHLKTMSDIFNGEIYSERHQRYHHFDMKYKHTTKDLTYNTSMIVFTHEQNDHLVNLMIKKFDSNDKFTDYFFKVLLPELCLLIFMDAHNMNRQEAINYLDVRPLD